MNKIQIIKRVIKIININKIIYLLGGYILVHETKNISTIDIFNEWTKEKKIKDLDLNTAIHCLEYIERVKNMDKVLLKETLSV